MRPREGEREGEGGNERERERVCERDCVRASVGVQSGVFFLCNGRFAESPHTGLSQRAHGLVGEVEHKPQRWLHTEVQSFVRHVLLRCIACCGAHERLRACVRLSVSTVVSSFVQGALCGVSTHWAFPARLPEGRNSSTCLDLTQWTHRYPVRCGLRDRIPSHLLSSCSSTTELRQTTGRVSLGCLASRAEAPLSLLHHSDVSTHVARASAHLVAESAGLCAQPLVSFRLCTEHGGSSRCAQHLVSSRLDSHLERRIIKIIKPLLLARTSPSLFLSGIAILADQDPHLG